MSAIRKRRNNRWSSYNWAIKVHDAAQLLARPLGGRASSPMESEFKSRVLWARILYILGSEISKMGNLSLGGTSDEESYRVRYERFDPLKRCSTERFVLISFSLREQ